MNLKFFLAALLCISIISLSAQNPKTLEGQILDSLNQPVSGVTITLKNVQNPTDKKEILTDSLGFFTYQVTDPSITLQATYQNTIFYNRDLQFTQDTFLVLHYNPNITDAQTLEAAVITATKKSTLEAKADRFVFTPNEDLKMGKSATELFNAVPMLQFEEMNKDGSPDLKILGKDNTDIYINGKRTFIAKEILLTMLSGQNATDIDKIEIIRNPNASYDVRPGGAIVNIIMKKNNLKGLNGNARLEGYQNSFTNYKGSVGLNYNLYNLNIQGSAYGGNGRYNQVLGVTNQFLTLNYLQKSQSTIPQHNYYYGGFNFTISYEITPHQTLQFGNNFFYGQRKQGIRNTNDFSKVNNIIDSNFLVRNTDNVLKFTNQNTLNYTFLTDKKGSQFEAFFNYFFYREKMHNITDIRKGIGNNNPDIFSENFLQEVPRTIHSFYLAAQYTHVFNTKHTLQGGFKAYYTHTDNPVIFHSKTQENKAYQLYPQLSTHLIYQEPIYSFFLVHNGDWSDKFQSVIGIKYDQTWQMGTVTNSPDNTLRRNWIFFLPTVSLNYNISEKHNLNYAFNSSVDKPSIENLNPYRRIVSNNLFIAGNPFILVSRQYFQELSYTLFSKYTFLLNYEWARNPSSTIIAIAPHELSYGVLRSTLPDAKILGAGLSLNESFFKNRWQTKLYVGVQYGWFNNDNRFFKSHTQGWGSYMNFNNTIILNSMQNPNRWIVNIGYRQTFKTLNTFLSMRQGPNLSMSITKKYKKWTFNTGVTDIFRRDMEVLITTIPHLAYLIGNTYNDLRSFYLSVSFTFGNNGLKTQRQKNSGNENKNRIR